MHRWWGKMSLLLVVFTAAACSSTVPAGGLQPSTSAPAPTAVLQQSVDALVAAGAPAAVIEVTQGDRRWSAAAGRMARDQTRPAGVAAGVRVADITKSMIAAVILQMVDEKQFTLDTSVDDILPGELSRSVTIRELLDHTSGLPNYVPDLAPSTVDGIVANADVERSDSELVQTAETLPWTTTPGASYSYANTNYIVLGDVIRAIGGTTVTDALQQRIFGPAGMRSSFYPEDSSMPDNALRGYLLSKGAYTDVTAFTPSFWSSSGAVVSTVGDVNRFYRALFDGKLLPPALLSQMQQSPEAGYGLGVLAGDDECDSGAGDLVFGQRGNGFGYRTLAFSSPDGSRQVALAWTASNPSPTSDPLNTPAMAALTAGLAATCPT